MNELKEWMDFIDTECEIEFTYKEDMYVVKSFNGKRYIAKGEDILSKYYNNTAILEAFNLNNTCFKKLIESNEVKIMTIF